MHEQLLRLGDLPQCHQLHYLQMAMEKAAKAHLMAAGCDPRSLQSSHRYIETAIPLIVREEFRRSPGTMERWIIDSIRSLARRIELLHPQVDGGGAIPANCEYPWEDSAQRVVAPANHNFGIDLHEKSARKMIRAVRARVDELAILEEN
ncbi:MAG: hypothetical protein R3C10_09885 [Pirellulales bacterium]